MLSFIRHKIFNKKWLNFCLLTGVILLSSFLCVYPMFKEGSLNKLLDTLFTERTEKYNSYPAVIVEEGKIDEELNTDAILQKLNSIKDTWIKAVDIPVIDEQRVISLSTGYSSNTLAGGTKQIVFNYVDDFEDHVELKYGCFPKDAASSDNELIKEALANGAVPGVVSQSVADEHNIVIGQMYKNESIAYGAGEVINTVIVGIVEEKDEYDTFWQKRLSDFKTDVFFDKEGFDTLLEKNEYRNISYYQSVIFNHKYITSNNAGKILQALYHFRIDNENFSSNFEGLLYSYHETKKSISVIMFTFEIPIVALLLLFIYMISGQILEMETGEIAMLKSRGVSRGKVISLYLVQSAFITLTGSVIGIPVGYLFCKLGASTNAFLVFSFKDTSTYRPDLGMFLFAAIAFALAMLFMTIPVIPLSKFTIIERRSHKNVSGNKAIWEKFFLDIPIVLLASYLLYNYSKQKDSIIEAVINGNTIDPVIFLNSSIFILGCGLFALRLIHLLVKLVYRIGKNKWKPDEYVAFLQIIRSSKKQGFISVFLVMTIAMGIFNSNLARSVNENMELRIKYNVGCDYRVAEKWPMTIKKTSAADPGSWKYTEPDYMRFSGLKELGVESMTKVIRDDEAVIKFGKKEIFNCLLLGVKTDEFGKTVWMKNELNEYHLNHYLNELAKTPNGIIISRNLADDYNLKEGDRVTYGRMAPVNEGNKTYADANGVIVGIVDAFPGYETTVYTEYSNGKVESRSNYLVVANYTTAVNAFNTRPYEVWMKFSKRCNEEKVREYLDSANIRVQSITSTEKLIEDKRNSTLIQITNGMFSIGFVISLVVCTVGFLIYWILTIRERELIYGIYRSMGLTMREVLRMLAIEQIFSSILACIGGLGVGMLTTFLFTKLVSLVYLPRVHNIPLEIIFRASDIMKMCVIIGIMLVVCFIVIYRIIKKMNITKAIKLGED